MDTRLYGLTTLMKMKRILIIITALTALYSCERLPVEPEEIIPINPEVTIPSTDSVAVCTFNISSADRTKSSISPDENAINDINIYAYRDGKLVEHVFQSNPTTVAFELNKGYTYNFYAISNMGRIEMPVNESQVGGASQWHGRQRE